MLTSSGRHEYLNSAAVGQPSTLHQKQVILHSQLYSTYSSILFLILKYKTAKVQDIDNIQTSKLPINDDLPWLLCVYNYKMHL